MQLVLLHLTSVPGVETMVGYELRRGKEVVKKARLNHTDGTRRGLVWKQILVYLAEHRPGVYNRQNLAKHLGVYSATRQITRLCKTLPEVMTASDRGSGDVTLHLPVVWEAVEQFLAE